MHIRQWDNELKAIAAQLEKQAAMAGSQLRSGLKVFDDRKYELIGQDLVYAEALAQARQLARRKVLGSPRLAALLHWVTTYAEKLDRYYKSQVKLLGKLLWLRLVHTRLAGSFDGGRAVGDLDLIDMVTRRQNLQKTEKFLRGHLYKLREQKSELHEKYRELEAFAANVTAARSMHAPLGSSYYEAAANPIIAGLESFIGRIAGLNSLPKEVRRKLGRTRRMIDEQSAQIMSKCRNAAMGEVQSGRVRAGATTRNHYEQCLSEIDLLEKLLVESEQVQKKAVDYDQQVPLVKRPANRV